jgi:hypothetical protein
MANDVSALATARSSRGYETGVGHSFLFSLHFFILIFLSSMAGFWVQVYNKTVFAPSTGFIVPSVVNVSLGPRPREILPINLGIQ